MYASTAEKLYANYLDDVPYSVLRTPYSEIPEPDRDGPRLCRACRRNLLPAMALLGPPLALRLQKLWHH